MAITALYSAAAGMRALDTKLDVLANNLANVNTVGFKRSRANFEDLLYQVRREPGIRNSEDEAIPHGVLVGLGATVSGTQLNFTQGGVDSNTGNPLDMMIDGEGFFQVSTIFNGQQFIAYTRAGNFTRNSNGSIVLGNSDGSTLEPPIQIDTNVPVRNVGIGLDGRVSVRDESGGNTDVGQIELARFVNPEGLLAIGKNLFIATDASGEPLTGNPRTDGMGEIRQSSLELSNVDPVRELIELITTQRAFELNSQSIQTADEALQIVGNLRR